MNNIFKDIANEIPSIINEKKRPILTILKYIDILTNKGKGFIKLDESEDLNKLLKRSFFDGKPDNLLTALNIINSSFNKLSIDKFTNYNLVDEQIDKYESIYEWNITDKFLFTCNRYGNYALKVILRLMNSPKMIQFIGDEYQRYKYILENQIYITDEKSVNNFIYLLLVDIGSEFKNNFFTGEFLYEKFSYYANDKWGINEKNKFTAIFSDPEYLNTNVRITLRSSTNLYNYHKYVLKAIYYANVIVFLTPANFLQTCSIKFKELIEFRNKLKIGNHLRYINYYNINSIYVKKNNFLINSGGLTYFIYDKNYVGNCEMYNNMIDLSKLNVIPTKINNLSIIFYLKEYCEINGSLKVIYDGSTGCFKSDDSRLYSYEKDNIRNIKVVTSIYSKDYNGLKNKGVMFCNFNDIKQHELKNINKWKVLISETCTAAGKGLSHNMIISEPGELYTNTFGVFIVNNLDTAKSLISYLKTNFVNTIIGELKIKNHINKHVLEYIPILPLDRIWDDENIFKFLNIKYENKTINY